MFLSNICWYTCTLVEIIHRDKTNDILKNEAVFVNFSFIYIVTIDAKIWDQENWFS